MIAKILQIATQEGASDIILSSGNYPALKKNGEIEYLEDYGFIDGSELKKEIFGIVPDNLRAAFEENLEVDFSLGTEGLGRFRVNGFVQKNGYGLVIRVISSVIPKFDSLGVPEILRTLTNKKSGLILVTGGVGSGKSTTLAALIGEINNNQKRHIITLEDPIEFVHKSNESLIEQREVGKNTHSFENGLKYALRQASDVIMIGEMRDLETFRLALRAAETGNLVFATLHTSGAARTVSRVIDMFPGDEKEYIRAQLAESLLAVVWQDLIKTDNNTRIAATEVMVKTTGIENMIRENHIHQINGAIETGREDGMIPMKKCLEKYLESGVISEDVYKKYMRRYGLLKDS